jgi:hypothetical protein
VKSKVLDPDSGVEQFRLMARQEQRAVPSGGDRFTGTSQIVPGGGHGIVPGRLADLVPGTAQDIEVSPVQEPAVVGCQPAHLCQRRFSQDRPVLPRGLQAMGSEYQHGPL